MCVRESQSSMSAAVVSTGYSDVLIKDIRENGIQLFVDLISGHVLSPL